MIYFTYQRDIQEPSKNNTSAEFSIQSASQQFATSKSSSTSSSFSSVDPSLPDRNISKGVFSNQSSLGDLPPLGGSIGTSSRNTLAPLKKIPSASSNKPQDNSLSKEQKNLGIYGIMFIYTLFTSTIGVNCIMIYDMIQKYLLYIF